MEVPRLGVNRSYSCQPIPQSQQRQVWAVSAAYTCNLRHSSWQRWVLIPLTKGRDRTCILMDASQILNQLSHNRDSCIYFFALFLWSIYLLASFLNKHLLSRCYFLVVSFVFHPQWFPVRWESICKNEGNWFWPCTPSSQGAHPLLTIRIQIGQCDAWGCAFVKESQVWLRSQYYTTLVMGAWPSKSSNPLQIALRWQWGPLAWHKAGASVSLSEWKSPLLHSAGMPRTNQTTTRWMSIEHQSISL